MKRQRDLNIFLQVPKPSIKTLEKYGRPSREYIATKRPICLIEKRQAAHCSSRSQMTKVYSTNKHCKNKQPKGSVKPVLFNIYEGLVTPSYKKPLRQKPTVLVTAGIREDKPPCHGLSLIRARALESAENNMQIARQENRKPVSSTDPDTLQNNVRSCETL